MLQPQLSYLKACCCHAVREIIGYLALPIALMLTRAVISVMPLGMIDKHAFMKAMLLREKALATEVTAVDLL